MLYGWRQTENAKDLLEQFIKGVNSGGRNQKPQKDARQRAVGDLVRAYRSDKDDDLVPALSGNPGRELRAAAASLSPFDYGKLEHGLAAPAS